MEFKRNIQVYKNHFWEFYNKQTLQVQSKIDYGVGLVRTLKIVPKKYFDQMQAQMSCTGRKWCDFMSFDPRMPEHLNKLIIRVDRDDKYIEEMEAEVIKFSSEIDEKLKILENL